MKLQVLHHCPKCRLLVGGSDISITVSRKGRIQKWHKKCKSTQT